MAASTDAANVKQALANSEPSTHGTNAKSFDVRFVAGLGAKGTNSDMAEATR
jgi:hypothetical protein